MIQKIIDKIISKSDVTLNLKENFVISPERVQECLNQGRETLLDVLTESDHELNCNEIDEVVRDFGKNLNECPSLVSLETLASLGVRRLHQAKLDPTEGFGVDIHSGTLVVLSIKNNHFLVDGNHRYNTLKCHGSMNQLIGVIFCEVVTTDQVLEALKERFRH